MKSTHRLDRILDNLKTESAFDGQFLPPQSLSNRMIQRHTSAVSIAVIDDFQLAEAGAFTAESTQLTYPIAADTMFLAGSLSKSVFAVAIMSLVQSGELDLDEDINNYLSSWKIPANKGWQPRVTLRQILSHSAGLTVHGFPGYLIRDTIPTVVEILNGESPANTSRVEVNMLPGLQFRYSGGGTIVAQLALCDYLKEVSFPALMHRLVFEPLGMQDSTFENPLPSSRTQQVAISHPHRGIPLYGGNPIYPEMAAAGLWTTPTDVAKFGINLLKSIRGDEGQLLSQSTIAEMLKPQLARKTTEEVYAGLGFFCKRSDDSIRFWHCGVDEGFVCEMCLQSSGGKGAVVILNSNEGDLLLDEILDSIFGEYNWQGKKGTKPFVKDLNLGKYHGVYQSKTGRAFEITSVGSDLILNYDSQEPIPFHAVSETKFNSAVVNSKLEFEKDSKGIIVKLIVKVEGLHIDADKLAK